ncbi:MAG: phosphatase PAP2 family protein [Clostridia bacterium]|nr:phosphatase PAP2 family protein [Clostridia bacterium]
MEFEANIILKLQSIFNGQIAINFFKIITYMGSYVGIGILFFVLLPKDKRFSIIYLVTSILSAVVNYLIKILIDRPRPYVSFMQIKNYLEAMGTSMPSSHSMIAGIFLIFSIFAINKFIQNKNLSKPLKFMVGLIIILVLLSRMVLGQHYISDILVGLSLGIIVSLLTIKFVYINKKVVINKQKQ